MAFDYSGLNNVGQVLLGDFGRDVVLRQRSQTLVDPAQPSRGYTTADTDTAVKAVFVQFSKNDYQNTAIEAGDKKCIVSSLDAPGIEIGTDDQIVDGGKVWQIVLAEKVEPGGVAIVWKLQVR